MTLLEFKKLIAEIPAKYDHLEVYLPDQEYGPYHIKLKTLIPAILEDSIGGPPIPKENYNDPTIMQLK